MALKQIWGAEGAQAALLLEAGLVGVRWTPQVMMLSAIPLLLLMVCVCIALSAATAILAAMKCALSCGNIADGVAVVAELGGKLKHWQEQALRSAMWCRASRQLEGRAHRQGRAC